MERLAVAATDCENTSTRIKNERLLLYFSSSFSVCSTGGETCQFPFQHANMNAIDSFLESRAMEMLLRISTTSFGFERRWAERTIVYPTTRTMLRLLDPVSFPQSLTQQSQMPACLQYATQSQRNK